jgi:hypothetical protein
MADPTPFVPLNPPPTDSHPMNTGQSTELGDTAKTAFEKINNGFAHIYNMLKGAGVAIATPASPVAAPAALANLEARIKALEGTPKITDAVQVAKTDFDALVAKVEGMAGAPSASNIPAADFEKLKADVAAFQSQFDNLGSKLEVFLGLKKA